MERFVIRARGGRQSYCRDSGVAVAIAVAAAARSRARSIRIAADDVGKTLVPTVRIAEIAVEHKVVLGCIELQLVMDHRGECRLMTAVYASHTTVKGE